MIKRETKDFEYKETVSKSYLKTVSAFVNFNNGTIIFGINDVENIVGIKKQNKKCFNLENQIIANVFHRLDMVEIFATGIKRINKSYKDFETKPTFDIPNSCISITLAIKKEIELTSNEKIVLKSINSKREYSRVELESLTG